MITEPEITHKYTVFLYPRDQDYSVADQGGVAGADENNFLAVFEGFAP